VKILNIYVTYVHSGDLNCTQKYNEIILMSYVINTISIFLLVGT